jgi:hypothetical protein
MQRLSWPAPDPHPRRRARPVQAAAPVVVPLQRPDVLVAHADISSPVMEGSHGAPYAPLPTPPHHRALLAAVPPRCATFSSCSVGHSLLRRANPTIPPYRRVAPPPPHREGWRPCRPCRSSSSHAHPPAGAPSSFDHGCWGLASRGRRRIE